jgi:hypothetical protein
MAVGAAGEGRLMRRSLVHQAWPVLTALPTSPVDGQEIYFQADAGPPAVVWHLRRRSNKWEFVGGAPIVYRMEGETNAYVGVSNGNYICVNASSKILQWVFTPPVDVWVDVAFHIGLIQALTAGYFYIQPGMVCGPAAAVGTPPQQIVMMHNQVQTFEPIYLRARLGLNAGTTYTIAVLWSSNGGTWQYHQNAVYLHMIGEAWPR